MYKIVLAIVVLCFSTGAFASQTQCNDHYTKDGIFFSGRKFHAWREYPGMPKDLTFDKVSQAVMRLGFTITASNKAAGLLSASHGLMGSSATVPLNVIITAISSSGSRVELTFAPQGGVFMSEGKVTSGFCDILNAVTP
jgi:hypothetical protein